MKKIAVYAGSFDPITNGHLWMIEKGIKLFDKLIIVVGENPSKKYMFTQKERIAIVENAIKIYNDFNYNIKVCGSDMRILVKWARILNANYILRGIRSSDDYNYEKNMRHFNYKLESSVETVFLMPPKEIEDISSSFVKSFIGYDGWQEIIKDYVPENVYNILIERFINDDY